ncbi:MAG TPA: hypothetical protein VFT79_03795 [Solirubrobacterales bacterium]|nr:hypothetical protein [Solirubrobacterales bacterium]
MPIHRSSIRAGPAGRRGGERVVLSSIIVLLALPFGITIASGLALNARMIKTYGWRGIK